MMCVMVYVLQDTKSSQGIKVDVDGDKVSLLKWNFWQTLPWKSQ